MPDGCFICLEGACPSPADCFPPPPQPKESARMATKKTKAIDIDAPRKAPKPAALTKAQQAHVEQANSFTAGQAVRAFGNVGRVRSVLADTLGGSIVTVDTAEGPQPFPLAAVHAITQDEFRDGQAQPEPAVEAEPMLAPKPIKPQLAPKPGRDPKRKR